MMTRNQSSSLSHGNSRGGRSGISANRALLAAVLWSAVVIAGAIIWKNRTVDESPTPTTVEVAAKAAGGPDREAPGSSKRKESEPSTQVTIRFPPRPIPEFELDECMGDRVSLNDLKGKRWVASFVFTRCATTCPTISLAMKKLHDRVGKENPDVRFVSMTVDPEYDSVKILKRYSETYSPDRERWKFLTGDKDLMHQLIVNGFGVYVKENLGADRRAGFEVAHTNRVVLVNEAGIPVGTWLATVDSDMSDLAQVLTGRKPFPEPDDGLRMTDSDGNPAAGVELRAIPVDQGESETADETDTTNESSTPPTSVGDESQGRTPTSKDAVENLATLTVPQRLARINRLLPDWAKVLPTVNALLNSVSTALLSCGWLAIRSGRRTVHRNSMIAAFLVSVVFLSCYLTSHWALDSYTGERGRPFSGGPVASFVYYIVLVPHIVLAAMVPFLAVRVFQHAFAGRWDRHRRLARVAFPVWMYVSVTGVIIYGMLYHWPAATSQPSAATAEFLAI